MKGKLWKLLMGILLFPIFPFIAIPAGEGDDDGEDNDGEGGTAVATRDLEQLTASIKGIADIVEEMPETVKAEVDRRIKEMAGDVKAFKEERDEKIAALEKRLSAAIEEQGTPRLGDDTETEEDYGYGNEPGSFDEMIAEVRAAGQPGGTPERLLKMHKGEMERRDLSTQSGSDGGFWMRPQFSAQFLQIPPEQQWLSSLVRMLPRTDPPNAEFTFNAFDQSGTKGIYGGVAVYSAKELATLTKTSTPKLLQVTLKPEKVGVYWLISEESQANTPQMGSMMQPLVNGAILSYRDDKIQMGTGAGEFKGFANSPAMIQVSRSVTDELNYIDLCNMLARAMSNGGGRFVWACQKVTMLPQLMTIADGSGKLIWADNAREGVPAPTLGGVPIFFNEISPPLGTTGDLRLINLDYYLVKPGMGVTVKSDNTYANFLPGNETIRVTYYEDGKPWITSPLTLRDGTNTVSPFIELLA
jgi:HK97 family phage major capsid protein